MVFLLADCRNQPKPLYYDQSNKVFIGFVDSDPIPSRICVFLYLVDGIPQVDPNFQVCNFKDKQFNFFPIDEDAVFTQDSFANCFNKKNIRIPTFNGLDISLEENNIKDSFPMLPPKPTVLSPMNTKIHSSSSECDETSSSITIKEEGCSKGHLEIDANGRNSLASLTSSANHRQMRDTRSMTRESYHKLDRQFAVIKHNTAANDNSLMSTKRPKKTTNTKDCTLRAYNLLDTEVSKIQSFTHMKAKISSTNFSRNTLVDKQKKQEISEINNYYEHENWSDIEDTLIILFCVILIIRYDLVVLVLVDITGYAVKIGLYACRVGLLWALSVYVLEWALFLEVFGVK